MAEILAWLETQKTNILTVTTIIMVIIVILAAFSIGSSKRGLEENKPWLKNIVIAIFLISFATTIVTLLMA